jgi:CRISPR system Cascade subunit CasC
MFIELHMIQSFAPSNLNRDDTNSPKDCEFGGVRRARISSQCIKRAMRLSPAFEAATGVEPGTRTRWLTRKLRERLAEVGKPEEEVEKVVMAFTQEYMGKTDKENGRTSVLVYISDGEIDRITGALLEDWDASVKESGEKSPFKKLVRDLVKQTRNRTGAPDIALFGRMLAEKPALNLDAACQVAHAISTHAVKMEMDFFTAVDDLQDGGEETGAGMMGFTGFNSACFYRYARIDWKQLVKNLDGDADLARRTVEGFLRAANQAVPTGKQNSFAAQNPPNLMLAVVRDDGMSWSLTNAFETPVRARRDSGLVKPSVKALDTYWGQLNKVYGSESLATVAALTLDPDLEMDSLKDADVENFGAFVDAVVGALPEGA